MRENISQSAAIFADFKIKNGKGYGVTWLFSYGVLSYKRKIAC